MPDRFLPSHSPHVLNAAQHKGHRIQKQQDSRAPVHPLCNIPSFGWRSVSGNSREPRLCQKQETYQDQPKTIDRQTYARAQPGPPWPEQGSRRRLPPWPRTASEWANRNSVAPRAQVRPASPAFPESAASSPTTESACRSTPVQRPSYSLISDSDRAAAATCAGSTLPETATSSGMFRAARMSP